FRLSCCKVVADHKPEWESSPPTEEVLSILAQPFSFLQRGSQTYVFASEDQKYVLKIFAKPLKEYRFQRYTGKGKPHLSKDHRRERVSGALQGYHLAEKLPQSASALIYTHLNLTENELPSTQIRDIFKRRYNLPLDRYRFVLQKKCEPLAPTLQKLARAGQIQEIQRLIQSYNKAIARRTSLSIRNSDTEFRKNFGILDGEVVEFDVGEYLFDPSLQRLENQQAEVDLFKNQLDYWLSRHITPDSLKY
ncbi:MAG: hypothetical protein IT584_01895, partial [Chlamydiae bacterium]|nr:hypothetical protein [Chlamydiota bacterium]